MSEGKRCNGEKRMRTYVLLLTGLTLAVLATGCVQMIPYRANLRLDIPTTQKRADELTIRMTEKLRQLDVIVKPVNMPLTMSYEFRIGKSLEGNLTNTLQDLFRTARVSSLPIDDLKSAPFVLDTELVSYDIRIGTSIFSTHTAKLVLKYSFYHAGRQMFSFETKTDGSSAMLSNICFLL